MFKNDGKKMEADRKSKNKGWNFVSVNIKLIE
jgi:hypothetical protein